MNELNKKLGPLPRWAWLLLALSAVGIIWYEHNKSSSSASATASQTGLNAVDPSTGMTYAEEAALEQQGIDPLTGQTYASQAAQAAAGSGGGGADSGGSNTPYPSIEQELGDVTSVVQNLEALGLIAPPASAGSNNTLAPPATPAAPAPATPASPRAPSTGTPKPATAVESVTRNAAAAVKRLTTDFGHGFSIENFRPAHPGSNEQIVGIGGGFYESRPRGSRVKLTKNVARDRTKVSNYARQQRNHSKGRR